MNEFLYQLKCLFAWLLGHAAPPDRPLSVRALQREDQSLTFRWRCDRDVVAAAVDQQAPTAGAHILWMGERLGIGPARTFIVERGGRPIGMYTLRLQDATRCSLGYMIAPEFRGQGLAKAVRVIAIEHIKSDLPDVRYAESRIRVENVRSIKTALRTGAKLLGEPANGFIRYEQALR